jgi:hypothetical protein
MNPERKKPLETGKAVDEYLEHLDDIVKTGNESPNALQQLKQLYLELERLWVNRKAGREEVWKGDQRDIDHAMRDGAVILGKHGMLE